MSSIHYCIIRIREFYTHYRHSLVFPTKQSPCSFSTYFGFSILTLYILWEKWISIEYLVKNGHTAKWYKVNFMHFEVRATWVSRSVIFSTSIYMHTPVGDEERWKILWRRKLLRIRSAITEWSGEIPEWQSFILR